MTALPKVKIKYLRHFTHTEANGKTVRDDWYWQPTPKIKELGFADEALGKDRAKAIARAEELNAMVEAAKKDQAEGRTNQIKPDTIAEWAYLWRRDEDFKALKPRTREFYEGNLAKTIEPRLGRHRWQAVTPVAAKKLYRKIRNEGTPTKAVAVIRTLSALWSFAESEGKVPQDRNPCKTLRLNHKHTKNREPWPEEVFELFTKTCREHDRTSLNCIAHLTRELVNRLYDMHSLPLSADRGEFMCFEQGKTGHDVMVPIEHELRAAIDLHRADIARRVDETGIEHLAASQFMVIDERTGKPFNDRSVAKAAQKIREIAGIDDIYVLAGLKHTGMQELTDAEVAREDAKAVSGNKSDAAYNRYKKPSTTQATRAISKRRAAREQKDKA